MPSNVNNVDTMLLKSIANGDQMTNQSKYGVSSIQSSSAKLAHKMDAVLTKVNFLRIYQFKFKFKKIISVAN